MAHRMEAGSDLRVRDRRARQHEYRLLVLLVFPFFLLFAVLARLWPSARPHSELVGSRRRSVFSEAREAAHTVVPFAFMG